MFAGDRDRERAVATLKEHFVGGRLSLDDLSTRTERALAARDRAELRAALAGLPLMIDGHELVERGRAVARGAARGALLAVCTAAWVLFSLALALALVVTLLFHGASGGELVGFLVVWLVPTFLLTRLWHRPRTPRRPSL